MNKRKRIAIITPTLLIKGGTQNQLLHLAIELKKRGCQCDIFTFAYAPSRTYAEFKHLNIYCVYFLRKNANVLRFFDYFHISIESFFLFLALFSKRKFFSLFDKREYDILNPHDWFGSWIASDIKRDKLMESKIVVMLNDRPSFLFKKTVPYWFMEKVDKKKSVFVDRIIVLDERNQDLVKKEYQNKEVFIVRSGVDLQKYSNFTCNKKEIRKKIGVDENAFVYMCASVPTPHRRFEDAILAMKEMSDNCRLVIIGDLSYEKAYGDYLLELTKNNDLNQRVIFINGFLSFKKRTSIIAASDVYLFPNENQTWGLGVIEAMAMGLPAIVSDGSGVSEVLKNLETALIYSCSNVEELVECMRSLENDNSLRESISKNAKEFVDNRFSWEKYTSDMINYFS